MVRASWVVMTPAKPASTERAYIDLYRFFLLISQMKSDWFDGTVCVGLYRPMITPAQCRAARGLLSWKQRDLAERSTVGYNTIRKFEAEETAPRNSTLIVLRLTFEKAGVEFIDENGGGPGLRLRK